MYFQSVELRENVTVEDDTYQYFQKSNTILMIVEQAYSGGMWSPQRRELNDSNCGFEFH
jgi:hypothetical protein